MRLIFGILSLPVETDRRVAGLVRVLNDLPDVYSCSSCGGHGDLGNRENAVPEGYFYVQFIIEPTEDGLLSRGLIDLAARNIDTDNLMVKVLNCTDNPKLVIFNILGKGGVDPDDYAREIHLPIPPETERIGKIVLDASFRVHTELGPGLLESVYETAVAYELCKRGLAVATQVALPVIYDGQQLKSGFRADLLVERVVMVELKAVEVMNPVFEALLMTYLRLSGVRLGFLINFTVRRLKNGIKRIVV